MSKFSVIIPVYNSEKHISRALDSVLNQSYKNLELIVVDDGSIDKSLELLKKYQSEDSRIKVFHQKNGGPGSARNKGVSKSSGEYIIFLDSDDYLAKNALEIIDKNLSKDLDLLRFQITDLVDEKETENPEKAFNTIKGDQAFSILTSFKYLDSPVCYCYKSKFYKKHKFKFMEGAFHEDFALIPLIIMRAKTIKSIQDCLYYYVKTADSTMTSTDYNKTLKKIDDAIKAYEYLLSESAKFEAENKDVFESYIANAIIIKLVDLNKKDYKKYLKRLKNLKVFDKLLRDTFMRNIKYYLLKLNPKLYLQIMHKN